MKFRELRRALHDAIDRLDNDGLQHALSALQDSPVSDVFAMAATPDFTRLRDNSQFQEFVAENLWKDRAKHGFPYRGSFAFDFVGTVYKDWIPFGLTQGDFIGNDDRLWRKLQDELRTRDAPDWLPKESDARLKAIKDPVMRDLVCKFREKNREARAFQRMLEREFPSPE